MALMNRQLSPEMETLYMMPSLEFSFLSSNLVKEVFMLGGSVGTSSPARRDETQGKNRGEQRVQIHSKAGKMLGMSREKGLVG